ncbi:endo-1,4-beta-xylanase [Cyclobacterium xiamenense]|uniref:endo-1,4-beta-xylanase n=1 Tax=Cyclobacterium xiamenense TaxID=1297121 RepID=UPI0035CED3CD
MKTALFVVVLSLTVCWGEAQTESGRSASAETDPQLKELFAGKFYVGAAMNRRQITGEDAQTIDLLQRHFNSITPENVMKSERIQPREGEFSFDLADAFVAFGEKNGLHIVGHTLIWHSQAPDWFFTDSQGREVSARVLKQRMETHIKTLVGRYKGRVHGWDVVNEAILDDGSYRKSKFYQILGEEFIHLAFQFAHEADPEAALYYNDYSMANPGKRKGVIAMVRALQEKGLRIDGIGMQGHIGMRYPSLEEFEKSIVSFADLGVTVMITELDLTVLPSPGNQAGAEISDTKAYRDALNPYTDGLPEEVSAAFTQRYLDFFRLFLKHADKISRVTTWGVTDRQSWKNNWPVRGRTDYPLLFGRDQLPKPIVHALRKLVTEAEVRPGR